MKKTLTYLISAAAMLTLSGCLDQLPESEIGDEGFYANDAEVSTAVTACYNGLHAPHFYEWMLTDLRSDQSRVRSRSSQTSINKDLMALDESKSSASLVEIGNYWEAVYANIARCNTVLANVDAVTNAERRSQYEGEALFIRSYHYFNLVRLFGPLFIVTEKITAAEARAYQRSSVEKVYTQIEEDLLHIVNDNLLPASYGAKDLGRVTIWSAKTLLAKVYLTLGRYEDAKPLLESVATESDRDLLNSYASVFSTTNEMNAEIIFAIRYIGGNVGLGNPFGNKFAPLNSGTNVINGNGEGVNYPTTKFASAYKPGDNRRDATILDGYTNAMTGNWVADNYCCKYVSPVTTQYEGDKDCPVLRFSDVLLMLAEIENELAGPTTTALGYLNRVVTRAGLPAVEAEEVPNKVAFRLRIEDERFVELAFENHRFFDLVRTGRYPEVMAAYYATELDNNGKLYYDGVASHIEDWQLLLPIPTTEIDINPSITQNPGY